MTDTVRVCLNSNGYTSPSGGYKAHSPVNRNANSHASGIGMEEWIGGVQFDLSSGSLKELHPTFCDLEDGKIYRVGLIEAYKCNHYPRPVRNRVGDLDRDQWRDVHLVSSTAPNIWGKVGEIGSLRGLTPAEAVAVHGHFYGTGLALMDAQVCTLQAANAAAGLVFRTFHPLPTSMAATDVFSCIFRSNSLQWVTSTVSALPARRYRWRY